MELGPQTRNREGLLVRSSIIFMVVYMDPLGKLCVLSLQETRGFVGKLYVGI